MVTFSPARARALARLGRWRRSAAIGLALLVAGGRWLHLPPARGLVALMAVSELALVALLATSLVRAIRLPREEGRALLAARLRAWLPAALAELLILEAALWAAAFRSFLRRPIAGGDAFTTMRTSRSGSVLLALALVTVAELPALHLLVHGWKVHLVITAVQLYGILWLIGDRRLMQESGHRLTDGALELRLGARWQSTIAYGLIERAARLDAIDSQARSARRVTPFDTPNVLVVARAPVQLRGIFGRRRSAVRLALFVDEPERFIAALSERISALAPARLESTRAS